MARAFLAESVAVLHAAATYADLHRELAHRNHALLNDGATMRDLRRLDAAWDKRRRELLARGMGADQ